MIPQPARAISGLMGNAEIDGNEFEVIGMMLTITGRSGLSPKQAGSNTVFGAEVR